MKKIKNKPMFFSCLLMVLCCAAFLFYRTTKTMQADTTAPHIQIPEEPLRVSVQALQQELLDGVTAQDDRDGDITEEVVIESFSNLYDTSFVTMTVASVDHAGNVAKAKRTLEYTDYQSPQFTLSEPLIFNEGAPLDVLRYMGAEDVVDGNLDRHVKGTIVSSSNMPNGSVLHQIEFRVTNSLGDTAHLTLPVEVVGKNAAVSGAGPELSQYLVYLEKNAPFQAKDYLKKTKKPSTDSAGNAADGTSGQPKQNLQIESNVDTAVPGVYTADYCYQIGEKNSKKTRLIVVVEE